MSVAAGCIRMEERGTEGLGDTIAWSNSAQAVTVKLPWKFDEVKIKQQSQKKHASPKKTMKEAQRHCDPRVGARKWETVGGCLSQGRGRSGRARNMTRSESGFLQHVYPIWHGIFFGLGLLEGHDVIA